jgi:hypothetical protein
VADEQHTGLSLFDVVLVVGGGLIALFVAFTIFSFVVGVVWFVVKVAIVVAIIAFLAKVIFGRRT